MAEYISRNEAINAVKSLESSMPAKDNYAKGYDAALGRALIAVREVTAADVQPVADTENMATVSDEFICKKCGIHIKDYIKVVMDEDNDGYIDEQHYEYEPKFCPECGAEVKGSDAE